MRLLISLFVSFICLCNFNIAWAVGYILYCPCMGRFGNQMEHFLGVLAFAKSLNRTLVLPPFVEYHAREKHAVMVDFDKYFLIGPLREFHDVIVMREFVKQIAPDMWSLDKRKAFCWQPRKSIYDPKKPLGCHAKEGNPSGPFWDYSNINFTGDVYYATKFAEAHAISSPTTPKIWNSKQVFPVEKYPVLAFVSAPAAFPALNEHHKLHKYLRWSDSVVAEANKYIIETLERPFIGIHLRNDLDWENVCRLIQENQIEELFGSAVCTSGGNKLTREMCLPSLNTIIEDTTQMASRIRAKSVFISSDRNHFIRELNEALAPLKASIRAHRRYPENLHTNLAILSLADYFVGNCVSTLSSFIYRQRIYAADISRPSSFFAQKIPINNKDEL
ncbi:unnamed protein product [Thelazia callipaeda]|uniref:GDP-fucose protein O-fucosyltransferase 1 n=1 Tax=Thelazia callipaeda TaxID=103827 RepID=A0A0N5D9N4_THECL|nr:unnamed protein product [Thelazia callipaeda]